MSVWLHSPFHNRNACHQHPPKTIFTMPCLLPMLLPIPLWNELIPQWHGIETEFQCYLLLWRQTNEEASKLLLCEEGRHTMLQKGRDVGVEQKYLEKTL